MIYDIVYDILDCIFVPYWVIFHEENTKHEDKFVQNISELGSNYKVQWMFLIYWFYRYDNSLNLKSTEKL